jgi:predicted nucleotidyltransferase component of viral defense system
MIPRAHITEWRRNAPWAADAQVEQDLVISRALVEVYSDPMLSEGLAFRGGTALHKLYLAPASRYSEDIDLVQVSPGPIGPLISALRRNLDRWLGEPRRKQSEGRLALIYRFESEAPPITPLRLKIEVNTREHFAILGFRKRAMRVESPWFRGAADVTTYSIEELLGTKLRAFYQRKKGRDLFDLDTALERAPELDIEGTIKCFDGYLQANGARVSRAEFEANVADKLSDRVFLEDMGPLLEVAQRNRYDAAAAAGRVKKVFLSRLSGEPWKGGV